MNDLIKLYQQRLNLKAATFLPIEHDDALVAIVYKIILPSGLEYILKICQRADDYAHEQYFLTYFADIIPVPRIITTIPPEEKLYGALLMECLPGSVLKISAVTDQLAHKMGTLLARIHLHRTSGYGDLTSPATLNNDPRLSFSSKFKENITECNNHLHQALLDQCQNYFDTHLDLLLSADGPCIIHRDFRPGNLLFYQDNIQGIIDWSAARAGFAQEDFCSMEHGSWAIDARSKKAFLSGYATVRAVPEYSTIMPLLRINKALATIGFTVKRNNWHTSNAALYQFNRTFLEAFFSQEVK